MTGSLNTLKMDQSLLTFTVLDCKTRGKGGNKNIYDIDVAFDTGPQHREVGFVVRAGSLKIALEIIEAFGQQTGSMNEDGFNKFKSKHAMTVFRPIYIKEDPDKEPDTLRIFKDNRTHTGFKPAFGAKKSDPGYCVKLTVPQRKEIDQLVRDWSPFDEVDSTTHNKKNRVRIDFRKEQDD